MTPEEFQTWRKQLTRTIRTKLEQCPDEGCDCILWTGALDSSGYASVKMKGTVLIVHRYVFEKLVGPIEMKCGACDGVGLIDKHVSGDECPDCDGTGLDPDATIDHLCKGHRHCMNPEHMEVVTRTENSVRANERRHDPAYRPRHKGATK